MLATILFIVILLSVFHYIYESLILPNIRMVNRYKLFALRDRLREIKISGGEDIDDKLFKIVDDGINNTIQFLPYATISTFVDYVLATHSDDRIKKRVEGRVEYVEKSNCPEVIAIANKTSQYLFQTLIYNSLMLSIYFLPLVIISLTIHSFWKWIRRTARLLSFTNSLKVVPQTYQYSPAY